MKLTTSRSRRGRLTAAAVAALGLVLAAAVTAAAPSADAASTDAASADAASADVAAASTGARAALAPALLSQGKPVKASSIEGAGTPAAAAVDGNAGTRWSSARTNDEWLQVDLGPTAQLSQVVLRWEAAYATGYRIEVSDNERDWTPVYTTATGRGGTETLAVTGSGRFVRYHGTQRAGGYGHSLWEFEVHGMQGSDPGTGAVRIAGTQGNWQLLVNGSPYLIKGLTWGPAATEGPQYLPDLRSMGVNTIRTWGTDATSKPLFDSAAANGIRVIAGFWLSPGGGPGSGGCPNYVTDTAYKNEQLSTISRWVTEYRNHPGVLLWNVGNESVLGLQNCYSGDEVERQRDAYTKFVNDVARAIHAIDPNHPVTSTDAWMGALKYYARNSPDLDLYAVNAYREGCNVQRDWIAGNYTKPYILTEGGPAGEWEVPNDVNGVPAQPTDVQKAKGYTDAWNCIAGHPGVALGATLFHYGKENDFGAVWFNLVPGGEKTLAYYAVRRAYSGRTDGNTAPVISELTLSRTTDVPAGSALTVRVNASDPDGDPLSHEFKVNSKYIDNSGALVTIPSSGSGNTFTVTAPQRLGVWKLYDYVRDGRGNVGIETRSFRVVPPSVGGTNLAQGRPATASSYQQVGDGAPFPPSNVTDGSTATRWASAWADPQWVQVDLGQVRSFNRVQLIWEGAYARSYRLEASDDGSTWRPLYSTAEGNGDVDALTVAGSGRFVRLTGTQRGTGFGYSLYEFGIYQQ